MTFTRHCEGPKATWRPLGLPHHAPWTFVPSLERRHSVPEFPLLPRDIKTLKFPPLQGEGQGGDGSILESASK